MSRQDTGLPQLGTEVFLSGASSNSAWLMLATGAIRTASAASHEHVQAIAQTCVRR
jgi:hypothetical protein